MEGQVRPSHCLRPGCHCCACWALSWHWVLGHSGPYSRAPEHGWDTFTPGLSSQRRLGDRERPSSYLSEPVSVFHDLLHSISYLNKKNKQLKKGTGAGGILCSRFQVRGASTPLTCKKTRDSTPAGLEAGLLPHGAEGHVGPAPVGEVAVHSQEAAPAAAVPQALGHGLLAAVHHAAVQEGGEGIDLLPDHPAPCAAGSRAEEREAIPPVCDSGVVGWDLQIEKRKIHQWLKRWSQAGIPSQGIRLQHES